MDLLASLGTTSFAQPKMNNFGQSAKGQPKAADDSQSFSSALRQSNHPSRAQKEQKSLPDSEGPSRSRPEEKSSHHSVGKRHQSGAREDKTSQQDADPRQVNSDRRQNSQQQSAKTPAGEGLPHVGRPMSQPQQVSQKNNMAQHQQEVVAPHQEKQNKEDVFTALSREDESVDSLTRRAALQKFIRKMKEELNVDPGDLVAAFSNLSVEELIQPPEKNLNKIIQQLDLEQKDVGVARQLFNDMLKQTASGSMADYLISSKRQLSLEVMSQQEAQQRELDQSLSQMSQSFFGPQKARAQAQNPSEESSRMQRGAGLAGFAETGSEATKSGSSPHAQGDSGLRGPRQSGQQKSGISLEGWNAPQPSPTATAGLDIKSKLAAYGKAQNLSSSPSPSMNSAAMSQMSQSAQESLGRPSQMTQANQGVEMSSKAGSEGQPMMNLFSGMDSSQNNAGGSGAESGSQGSDLAGVMSSQQGASSKAPAGSEFIVPTSAPSEADEAANVREVINQAQFMIKKGGGEMKVQLTPEGLGELTMKVGVQNGQVNVEMLTESDEAKKLLEKGLGDLKATLASHKLNVDQIKVDVSQDLARQFEQQREDAQRQMAHQFMEEFRNQNQSWRQGYVDIPGPRVHGSESDAADDEVRLDMQAAQKRKDSSRRLNLVA